MRDILPDRYPLDDVELVDLLNAENYLGHVFDYGVILPRARGLYEQRPANSANLPCWT